jgi:hypothetical protein
MPRVDRAHLNYTAVQGHCRTPDSRAAYSKENETPSLVMRYHNGIVTPAANNCFWYQDATTKLGSIYHMPDNKHKNI